MIEDYLLIVKILYLEDYINIGFFRYTIESLDQKGYIKNIKIIDIRSYNIKVPIISNKLINYLLIIKTIFFYNSNTIFSK